ncbi:isopenicillin N synthase family oxygenase [Rhodobacteraceae bacterium]|nr:isopenicillin N synthase family oxygenase [Paracoccaceae bacterium]
MHALKAAAKEVGFLTVYNTGISREDVLRLLDVYKAFFKGPNAEKQAVNMAVTGANRGWGAPGAEQVSADANPDYKEVFDCGIALAESDRLCALGVYAPNQWPKNPAMFDVDIMAYFERARAISLIILQAIAAGNGRDPAFFNDKFNKPMALIRGNCYPKRPLDSGDKDFGIAEHTDYGCLTFLATDGQQGLEVHLPDGGWQAVQVPPGEFIINFGEMLEFWTGGEVKATLHRVRGGPQERLSVLLFFNPNHDTHVAPEGACQSILAGEHLQKRFSETYRHLKKD